MLRVQSKYIVSNFNIQNCQNTCLNLELSAQWWHVAWRRVDIVHGCSMLSEICADTLMESRLMLALGLINLISCLFRLSANANIWHSFKTIVFFFVMDIIWLSGFLSSLYFSLPQSFSLHLSISPPPSVHSGLHRAAHSHLPRAAFRLEARLPAGVLPLLPAAQLCGDAGAAGDGHCGKGGPPASLCGAETAEDPLRLGGGLSASPWRPAGHGCCPCLSREGHHHVTSTDQSLNSIWQPPPPHSSQGGGHHHVTSSDQSQNSIWQSIQPPYKHPQHCHWRDRRHVISTDQSRESIWKPLYNYPLTVMWPQLSHCHISRNSLQKLSDPSPTPAYV